MNIKLSAADPTTPVHTSPLYIPRLFAPQPIERAKITREMRETIAKNEFAVGPTCHITNGDEKNVPLFAGQYHKTLPHDKFGQVLLSLKILQAFVLRRLCGTVESALAHVGAVIMSC